MVCIKSVYMIIFHSLKFNIVEVLFMGLFDGEIAPLGVTKSEA